MCADVTQLFIFSIRPILIYTFLACKMLSRTSPPGCLLTLNSSKPEFLVIGLKKQLCKINSSSSNTCHSAHSHVFTFDEQWTPFFHICLIQILLLSHLPTSSYMHSSVPRLRNCQYHRHLYRSLETWLLQLTLLQSSKLSTKTSSTYLKLSGTCFP